MKWLARVLFWGLWPGLTAAAPVPLGMPTPAPSLFERFNPGTPVPAPRLRVALTTGEEQVRIGCTRGRLSVFEAGSPAEVWKDRAPGVVLVVREGDNLPEKSPVFRVQIGAFTEQDPAENLAARMQAEFGEAAEAGWDPARAVWRVRMGKGKDPAELLPLLTRLRQSGFPDAWVTRETERAPVSGTLKLVDPAWAVRPAAAGPVLFAPPVGGLITVDGKPYRGLIEVRISPALGVLVINEVNLEDYLRGVVPEELGPVAYPQLEALKAQAVAARTYALANFGQFSAEGYDLCDTARCQVYGGRSSEHPLSDRAVLETRGEVLTYQDVVIQSLFTSTCGGHTEDIEQVFTEMAAPYLRAVACERRRKGRHKPVDLAGRALDSPWIDRQVRGDPDLLVLGAMMTGGLVPREAGDASWREQPVQAVEAEHWFRFLAQSAGLPDPAPGPGSAGRADLRRWVADVVGAIPFDSGVGGSGEDQAVSRAEVLGWLARAAEGWRAFPLTEGVVLGADSRGAVRVRIKGTRREVRVLPGEADLYAGRAGEWRRVGRLELQAGDAIVFQADADRRVRLLGAGEPLSRAADRFSSKFQWTITRTAEELRKSVDTLAPVGPLTGLQVLRRGSSGRVSELEISGRDGRALVEGFRIRRALDLPETLFTVTFQTAADGSLSSATFRGRGWGHGVGMCQTGAFGMAKLGAKYREILEHYYTGVKLVRLQQPGN